MTTHIHVYSETRVRKEWKADAASTFIMDEPNRFGWSNARMNSISCPEDTQLFGLLVDEVKRSWKWSFRERGLPDDVSQEVKAIANSWGVDGYGHTHLTQQELLDKFNELVMDCDPAARDLEQLLYRLIRNIADANGQPADPEDRRVIIWFDN